MGVAGHDAEAGRSSAIESGVVRAPTESATALTAAAQRELAPEISTRVDADVSLRSERPQLQRAHCDMDADEAEVLRRAGAWHARARQAHAAGARLHEDKLHPVNIALAALTVNQGRGRRRDGDGAL